MDHLSSLKGRGEAGRVEPAKVPLEKFVLDEGSGVRLHPEHRAFAYSDGQAVEERLLRVLTEAADLSTMSRELITKITDWPSEYHLSPQRHNLLRHLDRLDGARVLELGAGCGAVTRFLGERGAYVSAVEGSLIRARCVAALPRPRNVEVTATSEGSSSRPNTTSPP
jgi:hypothetical protein